MDESREDVADITLTPNIMHRVLQEEINPGLA